MEKLSNHQIFLIGTMLTFTATLINIQSPTVFYAKQQAWIPHLLAALVVFVIIWLIARTMSRFPKQDLFEILVGRFPMLGRVITLLYVLFALVIGTRDLRMLSDFINIVLLPATPLAVIAIFIMIAVIAIARGGLECLGRMTELYAPALIIISFLLPLMVAKDFKVMYLLPLTEFEGPGIALGTWFILPFLGELVFVAFLCTNRTFHLRSAATGLALGTFLLLLLLFQLILLIGIPLTTRVLYPSLELVRSIRITDFLDRLDLFVVTFWLPTIFTKLAICLYIVCLGMKRIVPTASVRNLTVPFGYLAFACSLWFYKNAVQLFNFVNDTFPAIAITFEVIIPVLLFLILRPSKKAQHSKT